jgi:hypothetical protein
LKNYLGRQEVEERTHARGLTQVGMGEEPIAYRKVGIERTQSDKPRPGIPNEAGKVADAVRYP